VIGRESVKRRGNCERGRVIGRKDKKGNGEMEKWRNGEMEK